MNAPVLHIDSLRVDFTTPDGTVSAVRDISFSLAPGEILGVVGESGSGKSQTWMAPLGLLAENAKVSGQIRFDGQDLLCLPPKALNQIRGKRIAMIFQDPMTSLNPYLKVGSQLMEALLVHQPGLARANAKRHCIEMLDRVTIPQAAKRFHSYPHELSGGMRQRVMIAMAVLNHPEILIADEPTTALDVTIQAEILDLISELQRDMGMAVVFITHDLGLIAHMCDRIAVMYAGQVVEQGSVQQVLKQSCHPYTLSLLKAVPRLDGEVGGQLYNIPGLPPDLRQVPSGCSFAPRCFAVEGRCWEEAPALQKGQAAQMFTCHRTGGSEALKSLQGVS